MADDTTVDWLVERAAFFERASRRTEYVCATLANGRLLVKTEDDHIGRSLFVKGGRGDIKVLSRAVSTIVAIYGEQAISGRTFIDVGANIGSTTVTALLSHPFADALALEPEPENHLTLRLNLILNGLDDRVTTMPVAASNTIGTLDLVVNRTRSGKHFIASSPDGPARLSEGSSVTKVPVVTLDSLAEDGVFDPERVGLLWIDAENHEPEILDGASALVGRGVPVLMEWDPEGLAQRGNPELLDALVTANYTHVANMRPDVRPGAPRYELRPASSLQRIAEEQQHFTDILVLRLDESQVPAVGLTDLLRGNRETPVGAHSRVAPVGRRLLAAARSILTAARRRIG